MTVAELIGKLRTKKRAAERSSFSHYLELIRSLASGAEADSDEVGAVLDATGKDESDLERDVNIQQQRNSWFSQMQQNRQAIADRIVAERDLQAAQAKLQKAIDELSPAIEAARVRMDTASQVSSYTMNAESMLAGNVLDLDLLGRESDLIGQLAEVNAELKPLIADRNHKQTSLENAQFNLERLQARDGKTYAGALESWFNTPADVKALKERIADLTNQIQQLDASIRPRQVEQRRLQSELAQIHAEKLKP
jgi:chromosome segregation ATPase